MTNNLPNSLQVTGLLNLEFNIFYAPDKTLLQFGKVIVRWNCSDSQLSRCQYPDDFHDLQQELQSAFISISYDKKICGHKSVNKF